MKIINADEVKAVAGGASGASNEGLPWWVPVLGDPDHLPPGFPGTPGGAVLPPGTF